MDTQKYQDIKELAYLKVQERLKATPSVREELIQVFTDWFQALVSTAKAAQQMASMPPVGEGGA